MRYLFSKQLCCMLIALMVASNAFGGKNKKLSELSTKNYFNILGEKASTASGLKINVKDLNNDGNKEIILENNQMIYVLEPACGGVVNYAFDKHSKTNLVKLRTKVTWGGVFSDCVLPGRSRSDWAYSKYNYKILSKGPDKLVLKLFLQGKSGSLQWVTFEKTFTLSKDNAALRVDYRFINDKRNVVPIKYGLWFHNGLGTKLESSSIFYTTSMGVMSQPTGKEMRNYGTVRGWNGLITKSGKGCAVLVDYRILKQHYFWSRSKDYSTVESHFGIYPVKAGESLDTTAWLVPFYGVGIPEGVSQNMTGRFDLKEKYTKFPAEFNLKFKASVAGKYSVNVQVKRLPSEKWEDVAAFSKDFAVSPTTIPIKFTPSATGSYVFRASAKEFGKQVFEMETCVVIGSKSGVYEMKPLVRKLLEPGVKKAEKDDLEFNSLKYVTKHVKWAKPFASGNPKVLFLGRKRAAIRDSVEVAERFGMRFDNSYLACFVTRGIYDLGAYYGVLDKNKVLLEIVKLLNKNKYDCFVISSQLWKFFNKKLKDRILQEVKSGAGLVLTAPEALDGSLSKQFTLTEKPKRIKGFWKSIKDHAITAGVPFEALPATFALPYSTTGKVLAMIGSKPLLSVFKYGKGRVAASSWSVNGKYRTGYYYKYTGRTFLPNQLYIGVGDIKYDYWEYQLSLLARMIYWSAKCDFRLTGEAMRVADGNKLNLIFNNLKAPEKLSVELTIRDKFYNTEQQQKFNVTLKPGSQKQSFTFTKPILNGIHFADVIVKSSKGTEWWGSASFKIDNDVKITQIVSKRKVWKRPEDFICAVNTEVKNYKNKTLEVSLVDSFERIFARQTKALDSTVKFTLPLKYSRGLIFTVRAKIKQNAKVISESTKQFILHGVPDARKMQVSFGWPNITLSGYHRFLIKDYFSLLKTLGATSIRIFQHEIRLEAEKAREVNLPILKSSSSCGTGGKFPFTRRAVKDKFGLIRKLCLSDPKVHKRMENLSSRVSWQDKYGALYRGGEDESNYITKWEGCYSKFCQKEFRIWLKKEYGSLKALNKEWDTDYSEWNQVFAMIAEEVKGRKSYAPWLDHRSFNERNFARALSSIKRGANRHMPNTRISLSGTPGTNAFNAWNWYRIMQVLEAIESYGGEQTTMQRCFKQGFLIWLPWIGYNSEKEMLDWNIIDSLFQGATGFSVFSGNFNINPDFTLPRAGRDLKASLDVFKKGKAEVIMNSEYRAYPITFLYSPASIKVNWMEKNFELYKSEVNGMKMLLADANSDYDYVAYQQLEDSNLLQNKYKMFYLPLSTALSDKEVAQIEAFVKNGGVLITDMASGRFSGHGRKRSISALDKVFGIDSSKSKIIAADATVIGVGKDGLFNLNGLNMLVRNIEAGIECTSGKALAEIQYRDSKYPACIVNKYGKGYTLYLGSSMLKTFGAWDERRYFKKNRPQVKILTGMIKALFKNAGIKTFVQPLTDDGEKLAATKCYLRQNGSSYIVGLVRDYTITPSIDPKPRKVTVKLFNKFHCYDLLKNKYLGFGNSFKTEVGPLTQSAFVLLPYKLEAVNISGSAVVERGKEYSFAISLKANTDKLVKHTLNIAVLGPDDKEKEAYSGVQFTDNGKYVLTIPVPLNAESGTWKIIATDVATRVKGITSFQLK